MPSSTQTNIHAIKILVFLKNSHDWNENFSLVSVKDGICLNFLAGKITGVTPVKMFVKKVVRGNAVQMFSNFPAKSLSI